MRFFLVLFVLIFVAFGTTGEDWRDTPDGVVRGLLDGRAHYLIISDSSHEGFETALACYNWEAIYNSDERLTDPVEWTALPSEATQEYSRNWLKDVGFGDYDSGLWPSVFDYDVSLDSWADDSLSAWLSVATEYDEIIFHVKVYGGVFLIDSQQWASEIR